MFAHVNAEGRHEHSTACNEYNIHILGSIMMWRTRQRHRNQIATEMHYALSLWVSGPGKQQQQQG